MARTIVSGKLAGAVRFLLLAGSVLWGTTAQARKVHLIVACDTSEEADLGGDVVADKAGIEKLFESNVPAHQLNIVTIEGRQLSPQRILNAVNALQVQRGEDSVVFYFTGHGAFDSKQGHFFALPGKQQLLRSELEQAIIRRAPRTAITITDCCAGGSRYRGPPPGPGKSMWKTTQLSPLFERLLFGFRGLVSITSSKPGELSLTRGDGKGSLFTYPFVNILDENASQRLGWEEVVDQLTTQVKADFNQVTDGKGLDTDGDNRIDQKTQTVHAFVLTPRLGLRVRQVNGEMKISEVIPLSPAFHALLELEDVVLKINGMPIRTEPEYGVAVDNSPPSMTLTVRDHRTGREADVTASLNW